MADKNSILSSVTQAARSIASSVTGTTSTRSQTAARAASAAAASAAARTASAAAQNVSSIGSAGGLLAVTGSLGGATSSGSSSGSSSSSSGSSSSSSGSSGSSAGSSGSSSSGGISAATAAALTAAARQAASSGSGGTSSGGSAAPPNVTLPSSGVDLDAMVDTLHQAANVPEPEAPVSPPIPENPAAQAAESGSAQAGEAWTAAMQAELRAWLAAAAQQAEKRADEAVRQGTEALEQTEREAGARFQAQRDRIDAEAAQGADNLALYNARQGDRGGIGAAQYSAHANAAAQNRLAVNRAQTQLSADISRQIASLRASGEFQKADAALELGQSYLSRLISLQKWAADFDLGVEQFHQQLEQWGLEYQAQLAGITGEYAGSPTLSARQLELQAGALTGSYQGQTTLAALQSLAQTGLLLAQSGVRPGESQLAALQQLYGYDPETVEALVQASALEQETGYTSVFLQMEQAGVEDLWTAVDYLQRLPDYSRWDYEEKMNYARQYISWLAARRGGGGTDLASLRTLAALAGTGRIISPGGYYY